MYAYLIGVAFIGLIWLIFFLKYKKLRKQIIFGGLIYASILIPLFLLAKFLSNFIHMSWQVVPKYWNPDTLFNLGRITGGLAIEDILFMIFVGGIVSVVYEIFINKKVRKAKKEQHTISIVAFFITALLVSFLTDLNPMYTLLIIPSFVGAIILIIQRPDLIKHAIATAIIFTAIYFIFFIPFNLVFNDIVSRVWTLQNLSGIRILTVPIEELLYALSFGLMWGPLYEYMKGYKS